MRTIYEYTLRVEKSQVLMMPEHAQVLDIRMQHGDPQVWALVDTEQRLQPREFLTLGTGHEIPDGAGARVYRGTYQIDSFVFHVFEVLP